MMPLKHFLLTLLVVLIWGMNFIFVSFSLKEISPFLLCAVRFFMASIPAIFFIKKPAASFKLVALYGLVMFALQFSLLFIGMHMGTTPGIASIIMQVQVFFNMFFAAVVLGERPHSWQILGALIAFSGIALTGLHCDKNISLLGFIFILAAAAAWGVGNLITKRIKNVNTMSLVVWGSFIASFPMLILSLLFEGPSRMIETYHHLTGLGILSVCYIAYASTCVAYGVWNWLVSRYPINVIVPFTLLVPIIGVLSSVLILHEPLLAWKLIAGLLVMLGLGINLLGTRFFTRKVVSGLAHELT